MAVSGGEILLNLLKSYGVEYIFCSPGTEWTPVWEGLVRRQSQGDNSLKYINCRHETLAISMAMGYAETTGRLPVVLLHTSVGTLNGAMAIRTAYVARVPMIIFCGETCEHTGDNEVRAQGWHWLGLLSDMGGPSALVKDYVKWSNAINSRDKLLDSVYRGWQIARAAPQGPVFLSISTELLIRSLEEPEVIRTSSVTTQNEPRSSDLQEIADLLIQSTRPVIITEHTGKRPEIVDKLTELAELLSIPVFESSLPYYANFPKNNPLYMGYNVSEALEDADTVFIIGCKTPWYPPSAFPGKQAKIILIDEAPWHENLPYWGYQTDLSIMADFEQGLTALMKIVRDEMDQHKQPAPHHVERLNYWRKKHDDMLTRWVEEAEAEKDKKPISSRWFLHTARKVLPADSIILDETLTHTRFVHQYLAKPGCYFKSAYGGLGVGMGEAAGVKLANPDRPVVHVVGDGSFNYSPVLAGLGMSQEYHIPLLTMILDNGGYGAMKFGYQRLYPEGWATRQNTYLGVDIAPTPDYTKVAEAFGAYGERLADPREIEPALNRAMEQVAKGRTALLDVVLK